MTENYLVPLDDESTDASAQTYLHLAVDTDDRLLTERHIERVTIPRIAYGDVNTDRLVEMIHEEFDKQGTGVIESWHIVEGLTHMKERS